MMKRAFLQFVLFAILAVNQRSLVNAGDSTPSELTNSTIAAKPDVAPNPLVDTIGISSAPPLLHHLALPDVDPNAIRDDDLRKLYLAWHHLHHHRPSPQTIQRVQQIDGGKDTVVAINLDPPSADKDMQKYIKALQKYLNALSEPSRKEFIRAYNAHADDDESYAMRRALNQTVIEKIHTYAKEEETVKPPTMPPTMPPASQNNDQKPADQKPSDQSESAKQSPLNRIHQQAEVFAKLLRNMPDDRQQRLTDHFLKREDAATLLAWQHAFYLDAKEKCKPPVGHANDDDPNSVYCPFPAGQPSFARSQSVRAVSLRLMMEQMTPAELRSYLPAFYKQASRADRKALRRALGNGARVGLDPENDEDGVMTEEFQKMYALLPPFEMDESRPGQAAMTAMHKRSTARIVDEEVTHGLHGVGGNKFNRKVHTLPIHKRGLVQVEEGNFKHLVGKGGNNINWRTKLRKRSPVVDDSQKKAQGHGGQKMNVKLLQNTDVILRKRSPVVDDSKKNSQGHGGQKKNVKLLQNTDVILQKRSPIKTRSQTAKKNAKLQRTRSIGGKAMVASDHKYDYTPRPPSDPVKGFMKRSITRSIQRSFSGKGRLSSPRNAQQGRSVGGMAMTLGDHPPLGAEPRGIVVRHNRPQKRSILSSPGSEEGLMKRSFQRNNSGKGRLSSPRNAQQGRSIGGMAMTLADHPPIEANPPHITVPRRHIEKRSILAHHNPLEAVWTDLVLPKPRIQKRSPVPSPPFHSVNEKKGRDLLIFGKMRRSDGYESDENSP